MSVELDESGGASRGRALDADESVDKQLERVLRSTVSSGHVGALSLDPKYFVFEAAPRKCFWKTIVFVEQYEPRVFRIRFVSDSQKFVLSAEIWRGVAE